MSKHDKRAAELFRRLGRLMHKHEDAREFVLIVGSVIGSDMPNETYAKEWGKFLSNAMIAAYHMRVGQEAPGEETLQ